MGRLEDFRPCLKDGKKFIRGSQILFVPDDGSEAVVLPIDQGMVLSFFDGQRSLVEIIRDIWSRDGLVNFRAFFVTLRKLKAAEALKNSDELPESAEIQTAIYDRPVHFLFRAFFKKQILGPREHGKRDWMFYTLSIGLLMVAAVGLLTRASDLASNQFLWIGGSYAAGLVAYFCAGSMLLTFKNIMKYFLLSYKLGSTPPLTVQGQIFGFSLKTDDEALFLTLKTPDATLYWLASNTSLFSFSFIWSYFMGGEYLTTVLLPLAAVLSLADLDPNTKSEATKFFRRFFSSFNFGDLIPYFRKRALLAVLDRRTQIKDQAFMTIYATFGVAWTFGTYYLTAILFSRTFPNLVAVAGAPGEWMDRVSAGVILIGVGAINMMFLGDSLQLIAGNLLSPFTTIFLKLYRQINSRMTDRVPTNVVRQIIESQPLFVGLSPSAVDYLAANSKVRRFGKGSAILIQDTPGHEMYVLLSGEVEVRHRRPSGAVVPIVSMTAPTVFGEMAILGQGVRTAHVIATEACECLMIDRTTLEGLKSAFEASQYEQVIGRIQLQQFIAASPMFQDMPKEIVQQFATIGRYHYAKSGEVLVRQGDLGDSFYLLVRGTVDVSVNGVRIRRIEQGGFFGEISLLAHVRRTATVVATGDCTLYQIRANEFWNLLTANLGFAMYIESVAELRLREDDDVHRLVA